MYNNTTNVRIYEGRNGKPIGRDKYGKIVLFKNLDIIHEPPKPGEEWTIEVIVEKDSYYLANLVEKVLTWKVYKPTLESVFLSSTFGNENELDRIPHIRKMCGDIIVKRIKPEDAEKHGISRVTAEEIEVYECCNSVVKYLKTTFIFNNNEIGSIREEVEEYRPDKAIELFPDNEAVRKLYKKWKKEMDEFYKAGGKRGKHWIFYPPKPTSLHDNSRIEGFIDHDIIEIVKNKTEYKISIHAEFDFEKELRELLNAVPEKIHSELLKLLQEITKDSKGFINILKGIKKIPDIIGEYSNS